MKERLMGKLEEPEWINAKRESDRSFRNVALGLWLACLPIALVMMFASQFEYRSAMKVDAALLLAISLACFLLRRRAEKGSLTRTFTTSLAVFGFIAGVLFLVPTGVTQWG